MLILAIGDFHIPHRAVDIPAPFRKLLLPGKIHMVLCTGNLTLPDTAEWLRSIAPQVHMVHGEFDQLQPSGAGASPLCKTVNVGPLRIGLVHGHSLVPVDDTEALALAARQLDVDVLVSGSTASGVDCFEFEGRFYVNPGSATGTGGPQGNAFPTTPVVLDDGSVAPPPAHHQTPSFVLLDVVDTRVTAYVYQCEGEDVKIVKLEYNKHVADSSSPTAAAAQGELAQKTEMSA
ncbi:Vacuolar protein sorting-associated protein 29 [Blastocladiella emersonii ATCC 22665]|nr:Vacuolar protein sorting-associated protein 29 [Blastocladiella emersonii ATCC 22665]